MGWPCVLAVLRSSPLEPLVRVELRERLWHHRHRHLRHAHLHGLHRLRQPRLGLARRRNDCRSGRDDVVLRSQHRQGRLRRRPRPHGQLGWHPRAAPCRRQPRDGLLGPQRRHRLRLHAGLDGGAGARAGHDGAVAGGPGVRRRLRASPHAPGGWIHPPHPDAEPAAPWRGAGSAAGPSRP